MAALSLDIISDLEQRELISQLAGGDELRKHLSNGSRTVYCGFDPTAESLHVGSLLQIMCLRLMLPQIMIKS